ncbi:MAG: hypothetical protein P8009_02395 [Gammaproteobacteria bacterium]
MGKPSEQELSRALAVAKYMRESGQDPYWLAKSLLNLNYRVSNLEQVMRAAEAYLRSGLAEREHTQLVRAIQAVRRADARDVASPGESSDSLGLG